MSNELIDWNISTSQTSKSKKSKKTKREFNLNTENKEEWLTPLEIVQSLGEFDLDPCSPHPNRRPWDTAKNHYWEELDGLKRPWYGRIWCNPPYGKNTFTWLKKLAGHNNGIALIFARTETKGFHSEIWEKADAVFFFKGRIKFFHVDGTQAQGANAPSCLVAYGKNNITAIETALKNKKIVGKLIILKN